MAKNFNADFYVTCATVIPVLLIAAAVQRQALIFLLHRVGRRTVRHRELRFLRFRASVIVIAGVVGEVIALLALYWRSEIPWQRPMALVATLILFGVIAAGPIRAYADLVEPFLENPTLERPPERATPGEGEGTGDGDDSRGGA
jgi:hypothetical protein